MSGPHTQVVQDPAASLLQYGEILGQLLDAPPGVTERVVVMRGRRVELGQFRQKRFVAASTVTAAGHRGGLITDGTPK